MSQDPLRDIQEAIKNWLTKEPYFAGIPIITEHKGDVMNRIDIALGKLGLCVVIEALKGRCDHLGAGAYSLDLSVGITITELVLVNESATGTKKIASEVLAVILCLLNPSRAACPAFADTFDLVNDNGGLLIYQVQCKVTAGFKLT